MIDTLANPHELQWKKYRGQPPNPFPTAPAHPKTLRCVPVRLDPRDLVHPNDPPVSELLYAGFLEHLGRCIYGGVVDDYRDPSPEGLLVKQEDPAVLQSKGRLGWRKDVMDLLSKDGDLQVPMMRWPGGNFVSNYHWQDGVGPIADRPTRTELAWLSSDPNTFGTNEFIDYCRATKIEPFICLNMGTGTLEEALAWLEYCNGSGDSHWANLRKKHTGRDEAHNVKYWGLGNEMWGPWQVGHLDAKEYTARAKIWAHALKLVDKDIKLISCGYTGAGDWDREVLATMIGYTDYHSIHFYTAHARMMSPPGHEYEKNVFGPAAAEKYIEVCQGLIDLANVERATLELRPRDVRICFDEWNVWDETKGNAKNGLEQWYDYTDMLGFVAWLHVLVRKSKEVAIACLAQSVNVIAPLMTSPTGTCKQTTYYPLRAFSRYMKNGRLLHTPVQPDAYLGPTHPEHIQMMRLKPAYVDIVAISASVSATVEDSSGQGADTSIRLSVLNRHPEAAWEGTFAFESVDISSVEVQSMYSDDMGATNTFDAPETVVPSYKTIRGSDWDGKYTVPKHSWAFFIFTGSRV